LIFISKLKEKNNLRDLLLLTLMSGKIKVPLEEKDND